MRILLTGATGALGAATARVLLAAGHEVVAAVRDPARASAELPGAEALPLDLADLSSVRALADALSGTFDVAILNAGRQFTRRDEATAQGIEASFGINCVANAVLASALRPRTARVVLVASGTHRRARLRNLGFPPPRWEPPAALAVPTEGSGQVAYATSKLALVLFGLEAARRWPDCEVVLYDPGIMPGTGLARDYPRLQRAAWEHVLPRLPAVGGISTPERSGRLLAELAVRPGVVSGSYHQIAHEQQPDRAARDEQRAAALFDWLAQVADVS